MAAMSSIININRVVIMLTQEKDKDMAISTFGTPIDIFGNCNSVRFYVPQSPSGFVRLYFYIHNEGLYNKLIDYNSSLGELRSAGWSFISGVSALSEYERLMYIYKHGNSNNAIKRRLLELSLEYMPNNNNNKNKFVVFILVFVLFFMCVFCDIVAKL